MIAKKRVLVCPLNWGLGHASRDVPIIKALLDSNFEVLMAGEGESIALFKKEFPHLERVRLPGYSVRYSRHSSQIVKMLFLAPRIILESIKEHRYVKQLVNKHCIDIIISDNRFGVWSTKTYNIFITHQLKVKFPGVLGVFDTVYQLLFNKLVKAYNECWIPDYSGESNLSGELSHGEIKLKNIHFVGPLSRFKNNKPEKQDYTIDILFILSGPEPQRSLFEEIIQNQGSKSNYNLSLVRGTIRKRKHDFDFPVYDMLAGDELEKLIKSSRLVICRSGYSSVMDLAVLQKKAVLVPTPGQTEQEYLAVYLKNKGLFYSVKQKNFDLNQAIKSAFDFPTGTVDLEVMIREKIESLKKIV